MLRVIATPATRRTSYATRILAPPLYYFWTASSSCTHSSLAASSLAHSCSYCSLSIATSRNMAPFCATLRRSGTSCRCTRGQRACGRISIDPMCCKHCLIRYTSRTRASFGPLWRPSVWNCGVVRWVLKLYGIPIT